MSEINQLIRNMNANTTALKVERRLGELNVTAEAIGAKLEEQAKTLIVTGTTLKERLDNFKTYIGADQFAIIAAGPSLEPLMKEWQEEMATKNLAIVVDGLLGMLPENHGLDRNDIELFVQVGMSQQ